MTTYAVIEDATGNIVNRIVLDDPGQWEVPAGHSIVDDTNSPMDIGGSFIGGVYTPPPVKPGIVPPSQTGTS